MYPHRDLYAGLFTVKLHDGLVMLGAERAAECLPRLSSEQTKQLFKACKLSIDSITNLHVDAAASNLMMNIQSMASG